MRHAGFAWLQAGSTVHACDQTISVMRSSHDPCLQAQQGQGVYQGHNISNTGRHSAVLFIHMPRSHRQGARQCLNWMEVLMTHGGASL